MGWWFRIHHRYHIGILFKFPWVYIFTNFLLTLRSSIYLFWQNIQRQWQSFAMNGISILLIICQKVPRRDFETGQCDQFFCPSIVCLIIKWNKQTWQRSVLWTGKHTGNNELAWGCWAGHGLREMVSCKLSQVSHVFLKKTELKCIKAHHAPINTSHACVWKLM